MLIAFASYRDRPLHPAVYFYEHDGVGKGKVVGSVEAVKQRSDFRPALSADGRYCAFASEVENQTGKVLYWDRQEKKLVDLPKVNDNPHGQLGPALSGDGRWLALNAWNRAGVSPRWSVLLYDVPGRRLAEVPGLNGAGVDRRQPALSGDGRWLAYTTATRGRRLSDVGLYDCKTKKVVDVAGANSEHLDHEPALSGDGRLLALSSDRPGGQGGRDVYLYDRSAGRMLALPGLNSAAHEQTPGLSAGGRYVVFVSERIKGMGERDVYLYDRKAGKLLPTPGLNSKAEDMDPCVVVLGGRE